MATIKIHLDTRTARKDGTSPLKMSIFHKGKTALVGLSSYVPAQNRDGTNSKVIGLWKRTGINKKTGKTKVVNGSSPLRESVVVCKQDTTIDQLRKYCNRCHGRWGITAL